MLPPWEKLRDGQGCPLCIPRADADERSFFVCTLSVSSLYLTRNQAYRGTCVAVYDPGHATRPSELSGAQWREFCGDLWIAESAVTAAFRPDHVNLELLGNTVPHLHMAIVPRYRSDPRWGQPIWTTAREEMATAQASAVELEELAGLLRKNLL